MELLRITRQIHCKAVEQTATLIHRQYNRDWGTSYSRPPIDPYTSLPPLLQNPGGATAAESVQIVLQVGRLWGPLAVPTRCRHVVVYVYAADPQQLHCSDPVRFVEILADCRPTQLDASISRFLSAAVERCG